MKKWTEDELNALPPVEDEFRLRGYLMTRLEILTDAARICNHHAGHFYRENNQQ